MDLTKEMIIIDDDIVTDDISYCKFDVVYNVYRVQYKKSSRFYNFSVNRIKYIQNSVQLDLKIYDFYENNRLLQDIKAVYEFQYFGKFYYHVILKNGEYHDYKPHELKKLRKDSYQVIDYMKQVAKITSLTTDDGTKLLCKQMEKIKLDDLNTALALYLKLEADLTKENYNEILIFPFGCNSSQYEAVKNAIYNKISVIEGPPGTGKTQTILNIIANIIIRNMNCQVVSNNNTAIENIDEKLKKYDMDFFEALLGRRKNKDMFIEQQQDFIPNFDKYKSIDIDDISHSLLKCNHVVREFYNTKKEIANAVQKRNDLELEYNYFNELIKSINMELIQIENYNIDKLKLLWNELICMDKVSFWNKIKYIFLYKIGDFSFYSNDLELILKSVQNQIYLSDLKKLNDDIKEKEKYIEDNKAIEEEFIELSMNYFKKYLSIKYRNGQKRYSSMEMWNNCDDFLNDYPVVLSTTYSSKSSFQNDFKFDYIIMDEASQIDVVTGTLALSSAKYAVIIGDEKQLPNVISDSIAKEANNIFDEFDIERCYSFSLNSFLSSIKNAIPNVQQKMLVEHYRCHPRIINFCNKKFYNNELVIMTEDKNEKNVITVIRTNKGNHARNKASQRQVDIIKEILSKNDSRDIGIIAPFNSQVDLVKENIGNCEVSTVHKFQGREKDTIIISTVEDDISDFVGDAKILNVAISRAKNHLYFIVTGNQIKNTNINDFIDYVDYYNMEIVNSRIYSSFDKLYKQYELERLDFFKKHNRVSKYDSENIIYYLIKNILEDYDNFGFHFHQSLNDLIKDKSLLSEEEKRYVSHPNTHLDFYIFKEIGDKPILAIEVDGYKNHQKGTKQYERDLLKNSILEKYNIPFVRLKTNGSEEEKIIRDKLNEIIKD